MCATWRNFTAQSCTDHTAVRHTSLSRKSHLAVAEDKSVDEKAGRPVVVNGGSDWLPQNADDTPYPPRDVRLQGAVSVAA